MCYRRVLIVVPRESIEGTDSYRLDNQMVQED